MDGRSLRYPDETFDGIFSSGSIEHFGELLDVAPPPTRWAGCSSPAASSCSRPSTRSPGRPRGSGGPANTLLLSAENLRRYIVEASGLEPVDDLATGLSEPTLATARDISQAVLDHDRRLNGVGARGVPEYALWDFPHLVMSHGGYEFTSVHLTLRRPAQWPAADNDWARPPRETLDAIAGWNANVLATGDPSAAASAAEPAPPVVAIVDGVARGDDDEDTDEEALPAMPVSAATGSWDEQRGTVAALVDVAVEYRRAAGGHLGGVLGLADQSRSQLEGIARDTVEVDRHIAASARVQGDVARRPQRAPVDGHLLAPPAGAGAGAADRRPGSGAGPTSAATTPSTLWWTSRATTRSPAPSPTARPRCSSRSSTSCWR